MTPEWNLALVLVGFTLLAASLAIQKKAVWCAATGVALLAVLAIGESDPLLFLGALAFAAARLLRPQGKVSPRPRPRVGEDGSPPRQS